MCNAVNWRIADGKTASPFSVFDIFVPLLSRGIASHLVTIRGSKIIEPDTVDERDGAP